MNKLVISLALVCLSHAAFASKARVEALQGANFLKDTQTIFDNPAHIGVLGQYLTLEMGSTSSTASPRAEGGFMRKEGAWNYGAYLGHQSDTQTFYRTTSTINGGNGYLTSQNPVEVFFGTGDWGASVGVSNTDKKTTSQKEQLVFGRFGMMKNGMEFFGTVEVLGYAKTAAGNKLTSAPVLTAGVEKDMGRFYAGAEILWGNLKAKPTTGKSTTDMGVNLTLNDMSLKTNARNLYYGASLQYRKIAAGSTEWTTYALPVHVGIEADLNTMFTLRGSVLQNVLLGSTKNEFAAAGAAQKEDTAAHNTKVAVGLGAKYNGFTVDGTVAGSTTGNINGNEVLTNASLTYNF